MDVNASKELVTRGAASESALRERKRELLSMNQQVLESTSFLARAQQNKSEVERRILELKSKRHNDAATELRETSLDIMRLKKKLAFSLQSMAEIASAARRVSSLEDMIQTKFFIVRQVAGTYRETAADEHTQVRAGDVVRVRLSVSGRDPVSAAVVTGSVN